MNSLGSTREPDQSTEHDLDQFYRHTSSDHINIAN